MMRVLLAILLVLVVGVGSCLSIQRAPIIDGRDASVTPLAGWTHPLIQGLFDYRVWSGARSGYVAMFAREGEIVYATTSGFANVEERVPMTLDTRMRIASITKPVTAVAAMTLVEQGRLGLDDPVSRYVPEAGDLRVATSHARNATGGFDTEPLAEPLRVRHLLMFASGIGGSRSIGEDTDLGVLWQEQGVGAEGARGSLAERVARAMALPLFEAPGTRWRYGGSADVLARVVEVASGRSFDAYLRETIFEPLGMTSTGHLPPPGQQGELARVYTQNAEGELELMAKRVEEARDWTPGGGGLVSTVRDYMRFGLMMRNRGELDGVRILRPETVELMTRPHLEGGVLQGQGMEGLGWGLGMAVVVDADATPVPDHAGDFWWAGYFGTYFGVSRELDLVSVVFSQYEPGPHTDLPLAVHGSAAIAAMGL